MGLLLSLKIGIRQFFVPLLFYRITSKSPNLDWIGCGYFFAGLSLKIVLLESDGACLVVVDVLREASGVVYFLWRIPYGRISHLFMVCIYFFGNFLFVNARGIEVLMSQGFLWRYPLPRIFHEHLHDQVLDDSWLYDQVESVLVEIDIFNVFEYCLFILVFKW